MTVCILVERLGPYHVARLRALGAQIGAQKCVAIEVARDSAEYQWDFVASDGFRRVTLFSERAYHCLGRAEIARAVQSALAAEAPCAVVVNGWSRPEACAAARWALSTGTPRVVVSASQEQDARRYFFREYVKRKRVACFGAAVVGGAGQAEYVIKLGMKPDVVFVGYDVVDNEHFARGAAVARAQSESLRRELRLPNSYILTVARFLPKKNLETLVAAFASYSRGREDAHDLVVLGDGPEGARIKSLVARLGVSRRVHFYGFQQYEALPSFYGLANAFVLPSRAEQWGLVVNEAMASGLPVIVSRACGAASELVMVGGNGFVFSPENVDELAYCLERLHHVDTAAMGRVSQSIVARWSPAFFARNMEAAVNAACRRPQAQTLARAWWGA